MGQSRRLCWRASQDPLKLSVRLFGSYLSNSTRTEAHLEHHGARGVVVARPGCGVGSVLDGRLWVRVPPGSFQRSAHLDDLFHSESCHAESTNACTRKADEAGSNSGNMVVRAVSGLSSRVSRPYTLPLSRLRGPSLNHPANGS